MENLMKIRLILFIALSTSMAFAAAPKAGGAPTKGQEATIHTDPSTCLTGSPASVLTPVDLFRLKYAKLKHREANPGAKQANFRGAFMVNGKHTITEEQKRKFECHKALEEEIRKKRFYICQPTIADDIRQNFILKSKLTLTNEQFDA